MDVIFRPLKRAHESPAACFPQLKAGGYGSYAGYADRTELSGISGWFDASPRVRDVSRVAGDGA
jgi:hypothetical protein